MCPLQHTMEIEFQEEKKKKKKKLSPLLKPQSSAHRHAGVPLRLDRQEQIRIGSSLELWKRWSYYVPLEECVCETQELLTFSLVRPLNHHLRSTPVWTSALGSILESIFKTELWFYSFKGI